MANQNVTITVDRSQILDAIRVLQQLIGYEQQASQNITVRVNTSELDRANNSAQQFASTLRDISTIMNTVGSGFGALGNFSSGIGNAFSGMSQLMGNQNISNAITRFLTYNVLRGVRSQFGNITSRYDIMSTFVPYMQIAGADESSARNALSRINESILGLPIGLDESAQRLRRYQMFLGDIDSATNLTIGAQHAILAGGANSQMRNMAYTQIDRLLAAGRLNTSRQWLSLIQGLGVSMRFVSEEMGVAGMDVRDLAAGLTSGAISAQSFLDALMALGEGSSTAAQGLEATLDIYKGTLEAWMSNINFAIIRGGQNVLDSLNAALVGQTGQGITGYMKNYRDFLNEAFGSISNWIGENPGEIREMMGEAYQLIQGLERFSASEVGSGVLDGLGRTFSMISTALNSIPEGKLEEFVSFATTIAGPASQIMKMSSSLGILAGVFERFKDFDFDMLIGDIADEIGRMAGVIERLLNLVGDERMSKLLAFGLVWGKPIQGALSTGANALSSIAMMRLAFGGLGIGSALSSAGTAAMTLGGGILPAVGLALVGTIGNQLIYEGIDKAFRQGNVDYIMNRFGTAPTGAFAGQANSVIQAAYDSYTSYMNLPNFGPEAARSATNDFQSNIMALHSQYAANAQNLAKLESARAALIEEYEAAQGRNGAFTSLIFNDEARAQAAQVGDNQILNGYEDALAEYDAQITQTKETMDALNTSMVQQGTAIGALNLEFGVYMDGVTATTEQVVKLQQASDGLRTVYMELGDAISKAFSEQVGGLEALDIGKPSKETGSFLSDYINVLTGNANIGDMFNQGVSNIADYIEAHPDQVGVGQLSDMVRDLIGKGNVEVAAPILDEIANALENDNWDRVQQAIDSYKERVEAQTTNLDSAMASLQAAEEKMIAFRETLQLQTATGADGTALFDPLDTEENNYLNYEAWTNRFALLADSTADGMAQIAQAAQDGGQEVTDAVGEVPGEIEGYGPEYQSATASLGPPMEAGFASAATYVSSGASQVIGEIQSAKASIEAEAGAINVTIPVNVTTTTSGAVSLTGAPSIAVSEAIESGGRATGGPIWKPFGSDTVPMMLTPGEYVIRKGAADFFGRGLLERINALDIGGAFDRLILNSPVTAGRYGGNVYNKDSHASVTQNYYNSSPDYGRRRAMRFAHAL